MLVDSHCHLHLMDLAEYDGQLQKVIDHALINGVERFLSVAVELDDHLILKEIAQSYPMVSISVGAHPNTKMQFEPTAQQLTTLANHPACIAIGETGLDYYRTESDADLITQRDRFRQHIRASRELSKPLIIHTRQAAEDTLQILQEEKADEIGGVMHCFSEDWEIAQRALDLNFYISFSGIVTFKNAIILQDVAKKVPLDRILVETDSPYLAPVPYRGKANRPGWVRNVAEYLSELREIKFAEFAKYTTENFDRCFHI
jgi:TatD DNase family protein